MVELSYATGADIERCLEIRIAAFANQGPTRYSDEQVASLLARDERPRMLEMVADGQLFVAKISNDVIGCGGWRGVNVHNLYVHPDVMRRGIGKALLVAIEDQYAEITTNTILHIDAGLYTQPFYESCGYRVIRQVVSSDGLAYLEMSKQLER